MNPETATSTHPAEQGDVMGRPGRPRLEVTVDEGTPVAVRVGGDAVTVLRGTMLLGVAGPAMVSPAP